MTTEQATKEIRQRLTNLTEIKEKGYPKMRIEYKGPLADNMGWNIFVFLTSSLDHTQKEIAFNFTNEQMESKEVEVEYMIKDACLRAYDNYLKETKENIWK